MSGIMDHMVPDKHQHEINLNQLPLPIETPMERRAICLGLAVKASAPSTFARSIIATAKEFEEYVIGNDAAL